MSTNCAFFPQKRRKKQEQEAINRGGQWKNPSFPRDIKVNRYNVGDIPRCNIIGGKDWSKNRGSSGKWVESCNGSLESRRGCEAISQYCIYMAELVEPTANGSDRHFRSWKISLGKIFFWYVANVYFFLSQNIFYRFGRNDFRDGNNFIFVLELMHEKWFVKL